MRIAYSLPNLLSLQKAVQGKPESATYLLQTQIIKRLYKRNHHLTFIGQTENRKVIVTDDLQNLKIVEPSWSNHIVFRLIEKLSWRVQQLFNIPYLNYFSDLRLFDVCMKEFPEIDVVYERHGLYKTAVARAAKRLGKPYILFFEADDILESDYMDEPIRGLLRWRAKQMMLYNLNAADCIICVSDIGKNHLVNNYNMPSRKIKVFPNGVDIAKFTPNMDIRSIVRDQLGWGQNPVIVFVGNFYEWHDVVTLLKAFRHVVKTHPEARLLMVGDGNTRKDMQALTDSLGLSKMVNFVGMVPHKEVPKFMAAADVAVVPYPLLDREIWFSPLKLYEYMASGTPVVASNVGQITQVIDHKRNGLLVSPEKPKTMADSIRQLLDDPVFHKSCSMQARSDAVNKYSWDNYVSRLEYVLGDLVEAA